MIRFKQFLYEDAIVLINPPLKNQSILSYPSSHCEINDLDQDDSDINEDYNLLPIYEAFLGGDNLKSTNGIYSDTHSSPILKPTGLTPLHKRAIFRYTGASSAHALRGAGSSKNLNGYLRNKAGSKKSKITGHSETAVHQAVQELSSAFTPENTNKENITTYSGIPAEIGRKLIKGGKGSRHMLAGFTSTTFKNRVAYKFADRYKPTAKKVHMLKMTVEPGAGLSVADHSHFGDEDEVLLHHGAHITYHGSEEINPPNNGWETHKPIIVHHVTVHATHTPLSEYGKYKEPKPDAPLLGMPDKSPKPELDDELKKQIDSDNYVSLHGAISHPNASPAVLRHAVAHIGDSGSMGAILGHHNADASVIRAVMSTKNRLAHIAAANHPAIDAETLHHYIHNNITSPAVVSTLESPKISPEDAKLIAATHKDRLKPYQKAEIAMLPK